MYCYNCMNKMDDNSSYCTHCHIMNDGKSAPHHLRPGTVLDNKYLVGNSIGEGGFGITYIGRDLNLDIKIAIKEFYPSGYANRNNTLSNNVTLNYQNEGEYFRNGKDSFLQEAKNIAKYSKEPGIVDVKAFFTENETAYIIMEYLDGMNLSQMIKTNGVFNPAELFGKFMPIMRSLEKMHRDNIIHRDISPENVRIMSDGSLKLMDFGSARYFAGMNKKTMSVQFKPGYAPFEQYNKNGNQGPWTDVYGLCATIYKCITGVTPVDSLERCQHDTLKKPSEMGVQISEPLERVLMYGLAIYPDNRCKSMDELINITERALRNERVNLRDYSNTSAIDDMYKTRAADEQNRTAFINNSYGDYNMYNNSRTSDFRNNQNAYSQYNQRQNMPNNQKKKTPVALIIVLSILIVAIIGCAAGVILFLNNSNKNDNDSSANSTTQTVTEQATTEAATETVTDKYVTVPYIEGMKSSDAYIALSNKGLARKTEFKYSDTVPEDYVISQSPSADEEVVEGATIIVTVSKGKEESSQSSEAELLSGTAPESSSSSSTGGDTKDRYGLRASYRYLKESDLLGLDDDETQFAINELYAKHGLLFTKDPYASYFNSMSWYHPDTDNYDVVVSRMNSYEKENLKVMVAHKNAVADN